MAKLTLTQIKHKNTSEICFTSVQLIVFLVLVGAINCFSVKLYVKSQDYLNYIIMGFIFFILGCGVYLLVSGKQQPIQIW